MIVAEFNTVAAVDVASGSCEVINDANPELADRCKLSGFERHGGAFILFGLVALAMAWGAGVGGSRPAGVALVVLGTLVIVWTLALDLPETTRTGALGRNFEGAEAEQGVGLHLALVAGGLTAGAGVIRVLRPPAR
jgi:hypothetical protein